MKTSFQSPTIRSGLAAGAGLRIKAAAIDLSIIAGWAAFAGLVGWGLRLLDILDLQLETAATRDAFAFATLVLPVTLTFTLMEASLRQATPGKHRVGLVVVDQDEQRLSFGRSFARSILKFAPWQMAHTALFHLFADSTATGYLVLSIAAQVLVLASVGTMAVDSQHRALHDLITLTRVRTQPSSRPGSEGTR